MPHIHYAMFNFHLYIVLLFLQQYTGLSTSYKHTGATTYQWWRRFHQPIHMVIESVLPSSSAMVNTSSSTSISSSFAIPVKSSPNLTTFFGMLRLCLQFTGESLPWWFREETCKNNPEESRWSCHRWAQSSVCALNCPWSICYGLSLIESKPWSTHRHCHHKYIRQSMEYIAQHVRLVHVRMVRADEHNACHI